ncbi:MAG: hypothetical protein ACKV2Q_36510 [Planctomycetaceae bacterium]
MSIITPQIVVPNTESASPPTRDDRQSARKLSQFIYDQYLKGLERRRSHERRWVKVYAILNSCHYFTMKGGHFRPLPRKANEIRAVRPVMRPKYDLELGRLNANIVGVTCNPRMGRGAKAFYKANQAQGVMDTWLEETNFQGAVFDRGNQFLLTEGMTGYYRYADAQKQQVMVKPLPSNELFPLPYDAACPEELDGIMRVHLVSQEWLESQDENYERRMQRKPDRPYAKAGRKYPTRFAVGNPGIGTSIFDGQTNGAMAIHVWLKPNDQDPHGTALFMLGDEIYAAVQGADPQTKKSYALPGGKLPIEIIYYKKHPNDFWGIGLCEEMIAPQLEANRQYTAEVKSAVFNKRIVAYDSQAFMDVKDIQNSDSPFIPFSASSMMSERRLPPIISVDAGPASRDVGATLQLALDSADVSAGHESGIIMGRAEGRVESGPANNLLNANAQAPLQPVLDRLATGQRVTFQEVLNLIPGVWPPDKRVRVGGPTSIVRERVIDPKNMPTSEDVEIIPIPLMGNGRNAMANILFQLRTMPAENGRQPELSSREFRRALRTLNLAPPGLDIVDKAEQRIMERIELLINDTQQPGYPVPGTIGQDGKTSGEHLVFENHRLAIQLLRESILDPAYEFYGPPVQQALMGMLKFHMAQERGGQAPDNFDDDIQRLDQMTQEQGLDVAEQDLGSFTGQMTMDGLPIGV